ncbi:MAG TPA: hypothetical protein DEG42_00175 [Acholeplasmataceae bacterium]|nr:hypothetical protein [Acholeplasmataceae bacterium]
MAAKGLFDYLNAINKKSLPKDEDKSTFVKGFSPFIINRFMSCEPSFVFLANAMNMNYGYTPEMVFDFYYLGVPKNNKFIKYNAKKEKAEKTIQYLMDWFKVNTDTAKQYATVISEEELGTITEYYENRGRK